MELSTFKSLRHFSHIKCKKTLSGIKMIPKWRWIILPIRISCWVEIGMQACIWDSNISPASSTNTILT